MISAPWLKRAGLALTILLAAGAAYAFLSHREAEEEARAAARIARQVARNEARREVLIEASSRIVPSVIEGVAIGMSVDALKEVRPEVVPRISAEGPSYLQETLRGAAQAMYELDEAGERVRAIQVLSAIPAEGFSPHMQAMQAEFGDASGVFRCDSDPSMPTIRFVWDRDPLQVQDVILVHEGGIAVTLNIAPGARIAESLRRGGCRQLRDRAELGELEIVDRAALERAAERP